jgi:hypothetical protein
LGLPAAYVRPCSEQGKLPAAKAIRLAERDKHMSEQEKPTSFMEELDKWTDANVVQPLEQGVYDDLKTNDPAFRDELVQGIKKAIRQKVLESYRNGQKAQGSKPQNGFRPRRPFKASA